MSTITPTNLRSPIKNHVNLYCSILQPEIILNALVNNPSIERGARTIAYDTGTDNVSGYNIIADAVARGVTNNIGTALMLEVDTAYGTELVRIKSITGSRTSGTITVSENGSIVWADNQVIRVRHFFQIIPVPPAIRSGVFYKDYDRAFVTGFATQPNPVAIIGSHLVGFLSGGSVAFSLNSSSSYAVADGATISSRAWDCDHNGGGGSGISFSSKTAANPTLTITEAGTYWLFCTVTDSNGKTQTTYRAIFAHDANNLPYQNFTIDNLSADWDSAQWRSSITLYGDLTLADVPDGSLCVLWMQNYFDAVEGYVNMWSPFGNNIIYSGYLWSDNDTDSWSSGASRASFEVISPLQYLDSITDYGTVSLEAKTTPSIWSDYASWLTVGRGIHHVLKWDTTILEVCDVLGLTDNLYGVKVLEFTEDTVLQRIQAVAYQRGIHARLCCNRIGQLYFTADSQMLNTAGRAALDTIFTLAVNDISGGPNLVRSQTDVRAFADMDGFGYSHPTSTPIISMIPGYIENSISYNLPEFRGTGIVNNKQQVLNAADAQDDCNERVGRALALENNDPKEIRIDLRGNYIGAFDIVPAEGWYEWGIADNALARELDLNAVNLVCRSVSHRFGYQGTQFTGVMQTVGVVLQPEAIGPDGIPGNYPTSYPPGGDGSNTPPPDTDDEDAGFTANFAIAYTEQGGGDGLIAMGILGSLHTGRAYTFESGFTVVRPVVKCLEAGKLLVVYDDTDGSRLVAKVLTYANGAITGEGTLKELATSETAIAQDVAILSSTGAVVAWTNSAGGSASDVKAIALTVSGTTITSAALPTTVDTNVDFCGICDLDSGRAFLAYVPDGAATAVQGVVLSITTTVITVNTIANASGTAAGLRVQPVKLSSSKVMLAHDQSVNLRVALLINVTTTFTFADHDIVATGINSTNYDFFNGWMTELSSLAAAVVWDDDNVSMAVIQDSASNIVVGPTQTNLADGPWVLPVVCSPVSGRTVLAYNDADTPDSKINSETINSTVVVNDNAEQNYETGTGSHHSICKVL